MRKFAALAVAAAIDCSAVVPAFAAIQVGMKVEVATTVDEDGYSRATAITPVN